MSYLLLYELNCFVLFSALLAIILILFAFSALLQDFSIVTIEILARYGMLCKFLTYLQL